LQLPVFTHASAGVNKRLNYLLICKIATVVPYVVNSQKQPEATVTNENSDRLGVFRSNVSVQSAISLADLLMATSSESVAMPAMVTDVRPPVDPTKIPANRLRDGPLK